jgi:type IV pilus assembly protein PilE
MKSQISAFTLPELVIALAIGAILVVLLSALSSYRSHVARSHRTGAASARYRAAWLVEARVAEEVSSLRAGPDQVRPFGRLAIARVTR